MQVELARRTLPQTHTHARTHTHAHTTHTHSLTHSRTTHAHAHVCIFPRTLVVSCCQVAVKFMFNERPGVVGYSSSEFKKASKLPQKLFDSGRIIYYFALCEMAPYMNAEAELVIMELAENGDLFDSIVRSTDSTQTPVVYCADHARRLTVMVVEAMATLRENGYLHRDLKAENLLFNKQGQMVLGDIGNIKDLEGGATEREVGGCGWLWVGVWVGAWGWWSCPPCPAPLFRFAALLMTDWPA